MTAFAELGLSANALKAVERLDYTEPTPVQEQAIPLVLEGRDLIAAASTGTGKTAAFLLPILSTLPRAGRGKRAPRVLVVTPTRELAQQISFTCIKIARATGHFVTTVYGGTPYGPQIRELRGGTDVLIATPGRLKDLMARDVVNLSCIESLVLDEADRMLDMGFLPDVTTIVEATPENRQTLLFSATIDESIKKNLGSLLREPAVVQIAHKGETAKTVEQFIMPITQREKADLLQAVLHEKGSARVIVFARTKNRTEDCATMLRDAGFSAESIHSDKSQGQRRRALENFRRGKTDILVATDVLARGIDVTGVDHVINYDLPDMPEDYVHRIGRTGRAGEAGYAISFVSPDTSRLLRDVERLINKEIPFMELETYELNPSILKKGKGGKNGKGRGTSASRKRGGNGGNRSERHNARDNRHSERNGKRDAARSESHSGADRTSRKNPERGQQNNPESMHNKNGFDSRNSTTQSSRRTSRNAPTQNNKRDGKYTDNRNGGRNARGNRENGFEKRSGNKGTRGGFNGNRSNNDKSSSRNNKNQAPALRPKKQRTNIADVRSFGEHKKRVRSKRMMQLED